MRVLVLHSRYLSGVASGENRVVEDEIRLLRDAGHQVSTWQPSVEMNTSRFRIASDAVWSGSAIKCVRRLLRENKPDVVHLHSLYPRLSPAVLRAVRPGTPVVMTVHNFRLMCLPATYLREGSICEDCARRVPWRGVVHACYRNSRPASAALGASLVVHRTLGTFSRVDRFLAVSQFVRGKHVEAGLDPSRIGVKSNFAWPSERRTGPGGAVLFLGRLSPEKGLDTVIGALPRALELMVAGDGPGRSRLERQLRRGINFLGEVDGSDVPALLRNARAVVVPSRGYEGQPRVILEAFAAGVPVVASRVGGLPELVEDGVNGYLVDRDDSPGWHSALERLSDDAQTRCLGDAAYATWKQRFTPEIALRELEAVYREVASGH